MKNETPTSLLRRRILQLAPSVALVGADLSVSSASSPVQAARIKTTAKVLILGAGAAGLSAASRLTQQLDGALITVLDARLEHHYQPGYTLVAAGIKPQSYVLSSTDRHMPSGVNWVRASASEIDPDSRIVTTSTGVKLAYDFLIVATGLELHYEGIEGMDVTQIGQNGLGSVYRSPEAAAATWRAMSAFADKGGVGLFGRPTGEMKCAGAPLKYTFITQDYLRRRGQVGKAELHYMSQNQTLFGVPIVSEKVRMLFQDRKVSVSYDHVLNGIDIGRRIARYQTPTGVVERDYDFIAVVPPMRAPSVVRNSPLPWSAGPLAADGWVETDKHTLRHLRYENIFAVGDVAGVPKGKTAASVKWQVPVAVDHLVADIQGKVSPSKYDGYTSCPLITQLGRAMLIEFDYQNNLVHSFPGVIAPLEELWVSWVMKTMALKPTYISMLHGRA